MNKKLTSNQNLTEKVNQQIIYLLNSQINTIKASEKRPLILISTGAYCPPHKVHIQNFKICKNQIKTHNVILGLISPSHDNYIKHKHSFPWNLNSLIRLNLLNSIIKEEKEENFILTDPWESEQNDFIDFPYVFQLRGKEIKDICKNTFNLDVDIGFIMGADLVINTRCMKFMCQIGILVIIFRPDWDNNIVLDMKNKLDKKLQDKVIIVQPDKNYYFYDSMSSTHIRNLFEKKDFEKVIQFTSKDSVNILNNYFKKFKER